MTDTTNETQVEVTQDRASEIACEIMGEMLGIPASEVSADCTGAKLIRRGIYRFEDCHRIQAEKRNNALAEELRALDAKATAGPWIADGPDHFNDYTIRPCDRQLAIAAIVNGAINSISGHGEEHEANAALVVALRNNLPAILAALEGDE